MASTTKSGTSYPQPLKSTGALEKFLYDDTTPAIGREFPKVNIVEDILNAENSEELIRELGITSMYLSGLEISIGHYCEADLRRLFSFSERRRLFPRAGQPDG